MFVLHTVIPLPKKKVKYIKILSSIRSWFLTKVNIIEKKDCLKIKIVRRREKTRI